MFVVSHLYFCLVTRAYLTVADLITLLYFVMLTMSEVELLSYYPTLVTVCVCTFTTVRVSQLVFTLYCEAGV